MKRNIWFTSDQHFGHESIVNWTKRPYKTVKEMNKAIIKKWNKQVKPKDIVYILGDFVWNTVKSHEYRNIMQKLNGNKILIVGNHDDIKSVRGMNLGFSAVIHGAEIRIGDELVVLSHYPYKFKFWKNLKSNLKCLFRNGHFPRIKHLGKRPVDNGKWLLCGHTHKDSMFQGERQLHIGWDVEHRLFSMNELFEIIKRERSKKGIWKKFGRILKDLMVFIK